MPEDYQVSDTLRQPVTYGLDGFTSKDFIRVVGLVQCISFPWIKRVRKSLIVGIPNADRRRDFTWPTTFVVDQK